MRTLVYTETNFVMSYATGRNVATEELLDLSPESLSIVIPSFCFMEAFSTFESERKRHNKLLDTLRVEIGQVKRNVISPHAPQLLKHLQESLVELGEVFNEFEDRLHQAIFVLSINAEIIEPTSEILQLSFYNRLIDKEPTDNLILASILHHADRHPGDIKILLTENRNDFDSNDFAKSAIQEAGIRYFADASKFLEWHRSQPKS